MYPPPGLDVPTVTAEHPSSMTLAPWRPIPGRRRTPPQTSTTTPLPLEDSSTSSLDLDTVSERTEETELLHRKRPRTSEILAASSSEGGELLPPESPKALPGVSNATTDAALESVNRNMILNLGRTTCRRIQPEPQPERGRSRSPEWYHSGLLVGTWYFLVPDHLRALVSEAVSNTELCQERRHIPGHDATPTGPAIGSDNRSDATTDVNAFWGRSSDEVHPRNLSPKERADYDAADAAEWKATVDSGSVRLLDFVAADAVRRERPDRVINSRMVRRRKKSQVQMVRPRTPGS